MMMIAYWTPALIKPGSKDGGYRSFGYDARLLRSRMSRLNLYDRYYKECGSCSENTPVGEL